MPFITQGKTNLKYILIVVVLAVIVGGGILGYYYSWIKDLDARLAQLELRLPEVKTPVKIATEDETTDLSSEALATGDWKIYRNIEYQFEIRYPPDWIAEEKPDNIGRFGWKVSPDANKDLTHDLYVWPEERFSETVFEDLRFKSLIKNITIDGRKAREKPLGMDTVVVPDPSFYTRNIRIDDISGLINWKERNIIKYYVSEKYFRLQSDPQLLDTFEAIVSTFKFLD